MDVKRRDLFTVGAAALGATLLPGCAAPQDPASTDYPAGDFIVRRVQGGLQVLHERGGDRVIWATAPEGDFIGAEVATAAIKEVGAPQGTFEIADTVHATYERPTIDSVNANGARIVVTGKLNGASGSVNYTLTFDPVSATHLQFSIPSTIQRSTGFACLSSPPGTKRFSVAGSQLTWLDEQYYPSWRQLVDDLAKDGGRVVIYINPFLAADAGHNQLFHEAKAEYDGIKTALVGILSGGVSGYSMMHSDVGGYVMLKATIAGKAIPVINRTPQLFSAGRSSTPSPP